MQVGTITANFVLSDAIDPTAWVKVTRVALVCSALNTTVPICLGKPFRK